jgi:hypothetical protein
MKPETQLQLKRKGAPACIVTGLVVTIFILCFPVGHSNDQASCKFYMSSGLTKFYEDVELIHNEFKRCIFNATHQTGLLIHQFTAVLDHGSNDETSFEVCLDGRDWFHMCVTYSRHIQKHFVIILLQLYVEIVPL